MYFSYKKIFLYLAIWSPDTYTWWNSILNSRLLIMIILFPHNHLWHFPFQLRIYVVCNNVNSSCNPFVLVTAKISLLILCGDVSHESNSVNSWKQFCEKTKRKWELLIRTPSTFLNRKIVKYVPHKVISKGKNSLISILLQNRLDPVLGAPSFSRSLLKMLISALSVPLLCF